MVKKALLVGIRYREFKKYQLGSAHMDVDKIRKLLIDTFQFRQEDIIELTDRDDVSDDDPLYPNRENLETAMRTLVAGAQRGDHLVFQFSGHGSQKLGYESKNELDQRDEAIWPADADHTEDYSDAANAIIDDVIKQIMVDEAARVGANLVIILDCCHSGTGADLDHSYVDTPTPKKKVGLKKVTKGSNDSQDTTTIISWAACQDPHLTISFEQSGGVFIAAFAEACRETPHATHRNLLHSVKNHMAAIVERQLKARGMSDKDRKTFNEWWRGTRSDPVLGILGDEDTVLDMPVAVTFGLDG